VKVKLHIGILILILTFFGVASQQQISVANQEIVLQFTEIEVTSQEAQNTIAIVKKHLQDLGVDNIQVKKEKNGKLKISYYSESDVASIKNTLSKEKKLEFCYTSNNEDKGHQEHSSDDSPTNFNFDIYEIQNANDSDFGLDGIVLEKKSENDRYYDPNVFFPSNVIDVKKDDRILKVSYKVWRNIGALIDNTSYIIPEVRAGPDTEGNS